jgi:hypothetical protein
MLAVISGSARLPMDIQSAVSITDFPFGEPSAATWQARLQGTSILTLARHGEGVRIARWRLREHAGSSRSTPWEASGAICNQATCWCLTS